MAMKFPIWPPVVTPIWPPLASVFFNNRCSIQSYFSDQWMTLRAAAWDTSDELDGSEIDLKKRSECERSNVN